MTSRSVFHRETAWHVARNLGGRVFSEAARGAQEARRGTRGQRLGALDRGGRPGCGARWRAPVAGPGLLNDGAVVSSTASNNVDFVRTVRHRHEWSGCPEVEIVQQPGIVYIEVNEASVMRVVDKLNKSAFL